MTELKREDVLAIAEQHGLEFPKNIPTKKLYDMLVQENYLARSEDVEEIPDTDTKEEIIESPEKAKPLPMTARQLNAIKKARAFKEMTKPVRCNVMDTDPNSNNKHGKLFTIINDASSKPITAYVSYTNNNGEGNVLPQAIIDCLEDKHYLSYKYNTEHKVSTFDKMRKQYTVTVLDEKRKDTSNLNVIFNE